MEQTPVYDFSNALVRCHAIYYIVAPGKEKTPKQKYEYIKTVLDEEVKKYDGLDERRQSMVNGIKKSAKIAGLQYELNQLESTKHLDPLSTGAKSYLKRLYAELKYNKKSTSKGSAIKYTVKGKLVELDAIKLISDLDEIEYKKNEVRLSNAFITGMPDTFIGKSIYQADHIPDVKGSWDTETFFENLGKPLNPLYWWQDQGYLDLTGADTGEVSYCLIDTPESLIMDAEFKLARDMDALTTESEEYKAAVIELRNNMTFSDVPPKERRIKFEVKRDDKAIQKIHETVPKCRDYLHEIQEMHMIGVFSDKELPILETIEEI